MDGYDGELWTLIFTTSQSKLAQEMNKKKWEDPRFIFPIFCDLLQVAGKLNVKQHSAFVLRGKYYF